MMLVWPDPGIQPVTTITMSPDLKNPLALPDKVHEGDKKQRRRVSETSCRAVWRRPPPPSGHTDLCPCQSWLCCPRRRPRREPAAGGRGRETLLLTAETDGPPKGDDRGVKWTFELLQLQEEQQEHDGGPTTRVLSGFTACDALRHVRCPRRTLRHCVQRSHRSNHTWFLDLDLCVNQTAHGCCSMWQKHEDVSLWKTLRYEVVEGNYTSGFLVMVMMGQRGRYLEMRCAALKRKEGKTFDKNSSISVFPLKFFAK